MYFLISPVLNYPNIISNLGANSYSSTQHMDACKVGAGIAGRTATLPRRLGFPDNTLAVQLCSVLLYCCNTAGLIYLCPYCCQSVVGTLNGLPILLISISAPCDHHLVALLYGIWTQPALGEALLCPGPLSILQAGSKLTCSYCSCFRSTFVGPLGSVGPG